jgi:2-polyprenyl-3-methyl-5-hydroxy-6-metoxy-1,4-benzoquinol methylase
MNPSCPICGSSSTSLPKHPEGELYRCQRCTHAFTLPESIRAPEEYASSYFENDHKCWFEFPNVALFKRIAAIIPRGASVLDVGCGRGDFLRFLRKTRQDLKLTGIDLTLNEHAEGIRFLRGDFFQADTGGPFDFVASLAVIEHVPDVADFVKRLRGLVRPGQPVAVMTLNESSVLYALARAGRSIGVPIAFNRLYSSHHLHHFTPSSLRFLFTTAGYSIRAHFDHNAPLKAMDIPVKSKIGDTVLRSALWLTWRIGDVTRRRYLQTIVCLAPSTQAPSA